MMKQKSGSRLHYLHIDEVNLYLVSICAFPNLLVTREYRDGKIAMYRVGIYSIVASVNQMDIYD